MVNDCGVEHSHTQRDISEMNNFTEILQAKKEKKEGWVGRERIRKIVAID